MSSKPSQSGVGLQAVFQAAGGAAHELILGGARSGKSRRAEDLAADWLAGGANRSALLVATALAADPEMAARIRRHQADRAVFAPGLKCRRSCCGSTRWVSAWRRWPASNLRSFACLRSPAMAGAAR